MKIGKTSLIEVSLETPNFTQNLDVLVEPSISFGDRKGTTKKVCDKDFTQGSGEFSGAICLKTLVLLGNDG